MVNHLITEPVKLAACRRCGNYTITGMSSGILATTDPGPLAIRDEIAARIAGKITYDLISFGRHYYLEPRTVDRIKAGRPYPVVATHACQPSALAPQPRPDLELLTIPAIPLPDDPPF